MPSSGLSPVKRFFLGRSPLRDERSALGCKAANVSDSHWLMRE
jgi:hypothetical protein